MFVRPSTIRPLWLLRPPPSSDAVSNRTQRSKGKNFFHFYYFLEKKPQIEFKKNPESKLIYTKTCPFLGFKSRTLDLRSRFFILKIMFDFPFYFSFKSLDVGFNPDLWKSFFFLFFLFFLFCFINLFSYFCLTIFKRSKSAGVPHEYERTQMGSFTVDGGASNPGMNPLTLFYLIFIYLIHLFIY